MIRITLAGFSALLMALTAPLTAAVYQVPGPQYATLQAAAPNLAPGDVVEVAGNATYSGGVVFTNNGTVAMPITIRGIPVAGNRPRLHGGGDVVKLDGDNYVFENFEITGSTSPVVTNRGIFCVANNLVVRNCVVHDCPRHGVLGADQYSGNVTLEYLEIYNCGEGTGRHQIYMATDNLRFPNATVRIQFCYLHNANGGNNIKTRAARNEIYYNWVEGAMYHELELIGADPNGQDESTNPATVREDSDVVGNVLMKTTGSSGALARIGGDGTGDSNGRFRFANNTMIMGGAGSSAIRIFDHAESLEMYNNVIWRPDGAAFTILRTVEQVGSTHYAGDSNWLPSNGLGVPAQWLNTVSGMSPGFVNAAVFNFTPAAGSPLLNTSLLPTPALPAAPFANPLQVPAFLPPQRSAVVPGQQVSRPVSGVPDVGSYEYSAGAGVGAWQDY